jgi:hypothetical protein
MELKHCSRGFITDPLGPANASRNLRAARQVDAAVRGRFSNVAYSRCNSISRMRTRQKDVDTRTLPAPYTYGISLTGTSA